MSDNMNIGAKKLSLIDVRRVTFDEEKISAISEKTSSLANPIRLKIVNLLMDYDELCVSEMEKALGLEQSKVSYHLASLVEGGVIKRRESGPWSFYSIDGNSPFVLKLFDFK
ncbi:MAG: ArsR/SmtB family transcription factor [Candidatus Hydrothermarchaeales archaeon]